MSASATDGEASQSVNVALDGAVDQRAHRMRVVQRVDGEASRLFVVNRTAYQECQGRVGLDGWGVEELDTEAAWAEFTPLGHTYALLAESNVYWRGSETVNGTEAAVIVAHPSEKALNSVASRTGGVSAGDADVRNATLTVWVDPESARPLKSRLRLRITKGSVTATATATTEYGDYGASVNTTPPSSVYTDRFELGCPGA